MSHLPSLAYRAPVENRRLSLPHILELREVGPPLTPTYGKVAIKLFAARRFDARYSPRHTHRAHCQDYALDSASSGSNHPVKAARGGRSLSRAYKSTALPITFPRLALRIHPEVISILLGIFEPRRRLTIPRDDLLSILFRASAKLRCENFECRLDYEI